MLSLGACLARVDLGAVMARSQPDLGLFQRA